MEMRKGEGERHWFRSDRYALVNGKWFFQTREGTVEGPYDSHQEAQQVLLLYLRHSDDMLYQEARF
ncbi:DUF6316 family protein [Marinobacter sp. chi1]|uniref:DUF6316 family protein n=2 Tax=Marinobacteraceae TaxID=2887365 RepID=A0ABT8W0H9_9GAMM|nr:MULTISPECIES: DUF6316 family protein [unclassified Marinobacter]MDO3721739.1 DUF6316 family protein [Marinobacter sp. chi1]